MFFGRRQQTIDLLQKLHHTRMLAVTGSSGCGKSSLVRAGLIPMLHAGFLVQERDKWLIATAKPGMNPLGNLAQAICDLVPTKSDHNDLRKQITYQGIGAITNFLAPLLADCDTNVLLLIDQFEELFRFASQRNDEKDPASKSASIMGDPINDSIDFVSLLLDLVKQIDFSIFVVITMRSDFLGDCDAFFGLPEALNESQYLVPRLTRQQTREAIEGPIHLYRKEINRALVDRLLNDTGDEPGRLPVMQHTLMRLWDYSQEYQQEELTLDAYNAIGTIERALSNHADEALASMNETQRLLTKKMFQALTTVDSANRKIRRPARLSEIVSITHSDKAAVLDIVDRFRSQGRSFLIVSSGNEDDPLKDDPLIDISHESLIQQWTTLSEWVSEEADSMNMYLRVVKAAEEYGTTVKGQRQGALLRDPELQIALRWRAKYEPDAVWAKRYSVDFAKSMTFLDKSRKEKIFQRFRFWTPIILLLAGLGTGAFTYFNIRAKQFIETSWMNAVSAKLSGELAQSAHLFAPVGKSEQDSDRQNAFFNLYEDLRVTLIAESELDKNDLNENTVIFPRFSQDGRFFLTFDQKGAFQLWKTSGEQVGQPLKVPNAIGATFSHDGNTIVVWDSDGKITLWKTKNVPSGPISSMLQFNVTKAIFTPDDQAVFSWGSDGTAQLWTLDGRALSEVPIKHGRPITKVSLHQNDNDHELLILTVGDKIHLINNSVGSYGRNDPPQAQENSKSQAQENSKSQAQENSKSQAQENSKAQTLSVSLRLWKSSEKFMKKDSSMTHSGIIDGAIFSPKGDLIISWGGDGLAKIWRTEDRSLLKTLHHDGAIGGAIFNEDGTKILTWSNNKALLWDTYSKDSEPINTMMHLARVNGATFGQNESILTWSFDGAVRLWKDGTAVSMHQKGPILGAQFNKNGKRILSWSEDGNLRLWNIDNGFVATPPMAHNGKVLEAHLSSDEKMILSAGSDGTSWIWRTMEGLPFAQLITPEVQGVRFLDDETLIAWSKHGGFRIWKIMRKFQPQWSSPKDNNVIASAFDNKGKVVTFSGGTLRLYDPKKNKTISKISTMGECKFAEFSPDGNKAVTWGGLKQFIARVWDFEKGTSKELNGNCSISGARFSPDSKIILTWCSRTIFDPIAVTSECKECEKSIKKLYSLDFSSKVDKLQTSARFWDASDGKSIGKAMVNDGEVSSGVFSGDGKLAATLSIVGVNGRLQFWKVPEGIQVGASNKTLASQGGEFSPDNLLFLSWSPSSVVLWDVKNQASIVSLPGLEGATFAADEDSTLVFAWGGGPSGKFYTASADAKPHLRPLQHLGITGADFQKDKGLMITLSNNAAGIWNVKDGSKVISILYSKDDAENVWKDERRLSGAMFSPDGDAVLLWGEGKARTWNIGADYDFPKEHLSLMIEATNGTRIDEHDRTVVNTLPYSEWLEKRNAYAYIAADHLKKCAFKEANIYRKQQAYWPKPTPLTLIQKLKLYFSSCSWCVWSGQQE